MPVYTVTNKPSSMTVQMNILYMDRLVTIINDLNLNLNLNILMCVINSCMNTLCCMHDTQKCK